MTRKPGKQVFAKKSLGQNFLSDPNYIRKIADALELEPGEPVLEIGPGRGALTRALLARGADVTALEIDRDLIPLLREEFGPSGSFHLVEGDALEADYGSLCGNRRVKLAANLPYYISTAIIQRLAEERGCFDRLVVMLQREVVDRIAAPPGSPERGYLSVLVQAYFDTEKLFEVPPSAFRPEPKVWSAVARMTPKPASDEPPAEDALFRRLVSAGFAQRRKTILNNLKAFDASKPQVFWEKLLASAAIEPSRRAETLTLAEWRSLAGESLRSGL